MATSRIVDWNEETGIAEELLPEVYERVVKNPSIFREHRIKSRKDSAQEIPAQLDRTSELDRSLHLDLYSSRHVTFADEIQHNSAV